METPLQNKENENEVKKKFDPRLVLLKAKTESYADDMLNYKPRLSSEERYVYWSKLCESDTRKQVPNGHVSWAANYIRENEMLESDFPSHLLKFCKLVTNKNWDHMYFGMFAFWVAVSAVIQDQWIPLPSVTKAAKPYLLVPLIFMMMSQLFPTFGMLYLIHKCNDLSKFLAEREITDWAFVCVLVGQYTEYFYYAGRNKTHLAGKCRNKEVATLSLTGRIAEFSRRVFRRRGSKVFTQESDPEAEAGAEVGAAGAGAGAGEGMANEGLQPGGSSVAQMTATSGGDDGTKGNSDDPETKGEDGQDAQENIAGDAPKRFYQMVAVGESSEMGMKARLKLEDDTRKEAARQALLERRALEETTVKDWREWDCIVCKNHNRRPAIPQEVPKDIFFGTKGVFYKRTYAKITPGPDVPVCDKCQTPFNYKPPLASAHLFPHYPNREEAFDSYPIQVQVQAGLSHKTFYRVRHQISSFFFGLYNNESSLLLFNDWRLRKYLAHTFPEMPRSHLRKGERYAMGEFVECKLQKVDWARARVTKVNNNHTYFIRYNSGEDLRFVKEHELRPPAEKKAYAYRVEMCMVFIYTTLPLFLALASVMNNPSLVLMGVLVVSVLLLMLRSGALAVFFYNNPDGGLVILLRMYLLFCLPLWLLFGSAIAALMASKWSVVAMLFVAAKFTALPILYAMRPTWALFGLAIFIQSSFAMMALGYYMDEDPLWGIPYVSLPVGAALTTTASLAYIRSVMHTLWDVQLIIRPPMHYNPEDDAVPSLSDAWEGIHDYLTTLGQE